jgi:hypothetical protein
LLSAADAGPAVPETPREDKPAVAAPIRTSRRVAIIILWFTSLADGILFRD